MTGDFPSPFLSQLSPVLNIVANQCILRWRWLGGGGKRWHMIYTICTICINVRGALRKSKRENQENFSQCVFGISGLI